MGVRGISLAPLRRAMEAKARGQASAIYLVFGGISFSASFLVQISMGPIFTWVTGAVLIVAGIGFLFALEGYVSTAMRHMLQAHLRKHPFPFEDNIAMTREIGELFGVQSSPEDTLDGYLIRLREVLGIDEEPSRLFQVGVPSFHT